MNRKAVYLSLFLIFGIILARNIPSYQHLFVISIIFLSMLLCLYFYFYERMGLNTFFIITCILLFAFGVIKTYYCFNIFEADGRYDNKNVNLTGFVASFPEYGDKKVTFDLKCRIDGKWSRVRVTSSQDISIFYGDVVKISGRLKIPRPKSNRFGFDYKEYLKAKGVLYTIYAKNVNLVHSSNGILNALNRFSGGLKYLISKSFDKNDSSLLNGLLLGSKSTIPDDMYRDFQRSGLAHLLAVSGGNVGILCAFIEVLFRRILKVYNRYVNILIILVIVIFAIITGLSSSVLRASIMAVIFYLGRIIYRNPDTLNSLAVSALSMLLVNPLYLFDVGFQLSFLSVLSILMFYNRIFNYICKLRVPRSISSVFSVSVAAQILILPLLAYYFSEISVISFFTNIIAVPLAGIVVPVAFLYFLPLALGFDIIILKYCIKIIVDILIAVSRLSHFKHSYIKIIFCDVNLIIAFYILIFAYYFNKNISVKVKDILYICACLLIVSSVFQLYKDYNRLNISIIDVGQGDSALLRYKGFSMLIDTGPVTDDYSALRRVVLPYILKNNVSKLDLLVLTHKHDDHIGDFDYLLDEIDAGLIVTSADVYKEKMDKLKGKKLLMVDNLKMYTYKDLKIYFLPPIESDSNSSVVTKISLGKFAMLFMGDASIESEAVYIQKFNLKSQVLKVGHHGSKTATSDKFLDSVLPRIAIISVGKNNMFSHPSKEVIDKLSKREIKIFRTDLNGTIDIIKTGNSLFINPYLR